MTAALTGLLPTLLGIGILLAVTVLVLSLGRVPFPLSPAAAVLRGAAQLAVISFLLSGVITSALWVGVALAVMFTVATLTAARRVASGPRGVLVVAPAMAAGVAAPLAVVFLTGAIEFTPRYVLAIGGIVTGNAMTIAALAGRRFAESVAEQWEQVEGWLALGATPRQSTQELGRSAVRSGLLPAIDQTKTTGLVTLPGAFVGAIFGGISPLEAGRFQIVVLASIIAAGAVTGVLTVYGLGPVARKPAPRR